MGLSSVFANIIVQKHQLFGTQLFFFFIVQLSHSYVTIGKTKALIGWTSVGKVMSVLFNMLSRLVIAFLPRSKPLHFMTAVTICSDFGTPKLDSLPIASPSICHEVMGPDAMILIF